MVQCNELSERAAKVSCLIELAGGRAKRKARTEKKQLFCTLLHIRVLSLDFLSLEEEGTVPLHRAFVVVELY